MTQIDYSELLNIAIEACIKAGESILEIYQTDDFNVSLKGDNSPLTKADIASNDVIKSFLDKTNIPVLSEEGKEIEFSERNNWTNFWLVDPLDGTKEFIKRNGEFTVNIAFIENGYPVMGIIYTPVADELFFSGYNERAKKIENVHSLINSKAFDINLLLKNTIELPVSRENKHFVAVGSRSHMSAETESYINSYKTKHKTVDILSKGSSLKLCLIAEGLADIYPRFAPTMEWDIAAGHAIIKGSGGIVIDVNTKQELKYNKENLLNPWFIAAQNSDVIS
ncbi:MAG: 3'(2'),5'-bisphosphate nucleotidase CysQ [Chlorobi bacterium]|nr:3'(2'),5'-bisphosphate nucleotidase CysQ [Chlorobiota bacterium]